MENILEKLSQEKYSPNDFYGFMYDTDDDASISGKSSEHFGWDWPEKDSPDQAIKDVVVQNNVQQEVASEVVFNPVVYEKVAEEVMEMANDQDEALSNQEVADDSLDDA
ncbi:hypothetical protein Tco_0965373 [Tanacetum coccineum]